METSSLNSPDYWESDAVDIRLNPKRAVDTEGLRGFLEGRCGIRSAVVIATSGSGGKAKFVVLPKAALLASARAVNAHGGLGAEDRWLAGLSTFHVGGIGILARAYCSGASVSPMPWDAWTRDGSVLVGAIQKAEATLTSLTPQHLGDLVRAEVPCPPSLRGVFLGGGRIDAELVRRARDLGWPLWPTYGMSEASSQIATSFEGSFDWLPLLPLWKCRTDPGGRLSICGEALFSGNVSGEGGEWSFEPACDAAGWFATGDRVELHEGKLRFLGRCDDLVKVSGELVSLSALSARVADLGLTGAVVAVPDLRRENELVLVVEGRGEDPLLRFNEGLPSVERASRVVRLAELPRTELGKPDLERLMESARSPHRSQPIG